MDDTRIPYEQLRNPQLPWGYWLVAMPGQHGLVDEDGRSWNSVREYLWVWRLGMPRDPAHPTVNQGEFLLAVLAAISRRIIPTEERVLDLFSGVWELCSHYEGWLASHGLLDRRPPERLTSEGEAILIMLASTRSAEAAPVPIGLPTLARGRGLDGGKSRVERERVLAATEAFAATLPDRFTREDIGGKPAIKLVGAPEGYNVPLARVLWSMTFADHHARDRFFVWILDRIDRWEHWAGIARRHQAQGLTEHFLALAHADRPALDSG